jgi:glucosylceramidase
VRIPLLVASAVLALVAGTALVLFGSGSGHTGVAVVLTRGDRSAFLASEPGLTWSTAPVRGLVLAVNEHARYQPMEGFGAALTDSSASLIAQLSSKQRRALMDELFSPTKGIGIDYLRVPMGASDFAAGGRDYSYDDLPPGGTDPTLAHFSIEHDEAAIIPALLQARKVNPELKLMGSPWSPPGWMKDSGSMIGGRVRHSAYPALAAYFVKFVQAYARAGLHVDAVTIQNEPLYLPSDYPGSWMTAAEEADFAAHDLAPAFRRAHLDTKILAFDHNWDLAAYADELLALPSARAAIDGIAFHCYGGEPSAQSEVEARYPGTPLYFTECTSTGPTTGFAGDFDATVRTLVIGATRNWARTVIKWNLALDPTDGPHLGGCGTCIGVVTIDPATGRVTKELDYAALGHVAKFVRPGARRIASSDLAAESLDNVAFANPDGSKVLIVLNSGGSDRRFRVSWGGRTFAYTLPSAAAVTFTWRGEQRETAVPSVPRGVRATASDGSVRLDWTFSPLARSYRVTRSPGGRSATVTLPTFTDGAVQNGTAYAYSVRALDAAGASAPSAGVRVTPAAPRPRAGGATIQAESYDVGHGVTLERSSDLGAGGDVGHAEDGDWIAWNAVDFGAGGFRHAQIRVASGSEGGTIELRRGSPTGPLVARFHVASTGDWQTWATLRAPVRPGLRGVQRLSVDFAGASQTTGVANLNWLRLTR